MGDTHEGESRPTTTRSRPDADSILSGLARMRSGDSSEQVTPENRSDEDPNVDDTDDHGDEVQTQAKPGKAKPAKKPVRAPEPEPEDDDPDVEDEIEEPESEAVGDEPEEIEDLAATEAEPEPEPEEAKPDPELERRARALRKQEMRMRERARTEREEVGREREALRREREELAEWKRAKASAKLDPAGYLRAAGLTEDDFEPAAKQIYALTREAAKDPKNREAVERSMRERELQLEVEKLRQRLDKQDEGRQHQEREERERAEAVRYMTGVQKAAKPGTLAAHYLSKGGGAAERTMQILAGITAELAEDDELPLPSEVLAEYERRRRAELEDDGVDVDAILRRKAAPVAANGKKPNGAPAKPAVNGKPAPRAAAPAKPAPAARETQRIADPEERKDAVLRDLAAIREKKRAAEARD